MKIKVGCARNFSSFWNLELYLKNDFYTDWPIHKSGKVNTWTKIYITSISRDPTPPVPMDDRLDKYRPEAPAEPIFLLDT